MHRCYKQAVIMMAAAAVVLSHAGAQSVRSTTSAYPYDIGGSFSPPVKIILAMLIFGMFFIAFLSLYIRKCLEHSSGETRQTLPIVNNRRGSRLKFPSGLDRSVVESFPVFVYSDVKKLKIEKGALECAVCISEFSDDERLRILPKCHHVFHPDCIDAWLASHITCPVCRADLTKAKLNADSVFNHELTQSEIEDSRTETGSQNHNLVQVEEEHREITKFSRSHSTGHSLVSPGENCERYTLRLPEEVWRQIVTLKRAKSCGCGVDENSKRGRPPDRICGRSPVTLMPVFIGKTNSVGKTDPAQSSGTTSLPV